MTDAIARKGEELTAKTEGALTQYRTEIGRFESAFKKLGTKKDQSSIKE